MRSALVRAGHPWHTVLARELQLRALNVAVVNELAGEMRLCMLTRLRSHFR